MSQSMHNAAMQVHATREAARETARAQRAQIGYQENLRKKREEELAKCIEVFASMDESSLFKKGDKQLAEFQSAYPPESPQYALSLNEWNRRLVARQIRATRFAAFIGMLGTVLGVVLGWLLASLSQSRTP